MPPKKTLLYLVLAVLSITLISLFLTLSILSVQKKQELPTGYVVADTGNVTVTVVNTISITTEDSSLIDLGGCSAGNIIYSNESQGGNTSPCVNYEPGAIIVRNDGNQAVNVTFTANDWGEAHGGTLLNSTTNTSWIAYAVYNTTSHENYSGGCYGMLPTGWNNITNGLRQPGCTSLQGNTVNNSFSFAIALYVPPTTIGGNNTLALEFIAKAAP